MLHNDSKGTGCDHKYWQKYKQTVQLETTLHAVNATYAHDASSSKSEQKPQNTCGHREAHFIWWYQTEIKPSAFFSRGPKMGHNIPVTGGLWPISVADSRGKTVVNENRTIARLVK